MADAEELQNQLAKFQADNPWIYSLIEYFYPHFTQINWSAMTAGIKDNYVANYLVPSYSLAKATMNSIELSPTAISSAEATRSAKILFDETRGLYDRTVSAGKIGWELLRADDSMRVVGEVLRTFVVASYAQAEASFQLHNSGAVRAFADSVTARINAAVAANSMTYADGELLAARVEKTLQEHASATQSALRAISWLDDQGYLDGVKKKPLGEIGTATIIVISIAAIAAVATVIVCAIQISAVNEMIAEECSKFKDEAQRVACIKAASSNMPKINAGDIVGNMMPWLVGGGLIMAGVYFLPVIVRSLKGASDAARGK